MPQLAKNLLNQFHQACGLAFVSTLMIVKSTEKKKQLVCH